MDQVHLKAQKAQVSIQQHGLIASWKSSALCGLGSWPTILFTSQNKLTTLIFCTSCNGLMPCIILHLMNWAHASYYYQNHVMGCHISLASQVWLRTPIFYGSWTCAKNFKPPLVAAVSGIFFHGIPQQT